MRIGASIALLALTIAAARGQTEFSQENAARLLKVLSVDIGPRPMGSPAEQRALRFAVETFRKNGCDTAYVMAMAHSSRANTTSGIAVGVKHGASKRIILIGGHLDSAGPEIPGADDDGSGAATVMEAARVLCARPTRSTLVFCCWGGEEQGLEGSKYFVDHYPDLDSVDLMLQVDMANGTGTIDLDPDTHGRSAPAWLVRAAVEEFYGLGYDHLNYATHFYSLNYAANEGSGSDHESFLRAGIPAIDFTTDVTKPIHTPRDNFENFDPRGLKRSGDLIVKLAGRFDGGVPSREVQQYWLYLLGTTPLVLSFPMLWVFVLLALVLTVIAFVLVRRRREPPDAPTRVWWSGVKMWLFSGIVTACAWFSSDVIGLLRNLRHPWMTAIPLYYLLAAVAAGIGIWWSLQLAGRLRLSRCPYVFFKRAAIMLFVLLCLFGLVNIKLMVEPAVALLLISLAMLVRPPWLKLAFAALSPWWMLRVIFSEWSPLFFRAAATALPSDPLTWIMFNGIAMILLSIYLLPFLYAGAAVVRDSEGLAFLPPLLRSNLAIGALTLACTALAAYLLSQPVYDRYWYRDLRVEQRYDMERHRKEISLRSGEYLTNLNVTRGGADTLVDSRSSEASLDPSSAFDTTWLSVRRTEQTSRKEGTTTYDVELTLAATRRPYTVTVNYYGGRDNLESFTTDWWWTENRDFRIISWYSFPDSVLRIPVRFQIAGNDSVRESIEVTFDELADPMTFQRELTYVIPRTRYLAGHIYRNSGNPPGSATASASP